MLRKTKHFSRNKGADLPNRHRRHLNLELLENRCLLSSVTNFLDHGPGSLRDAIATTLGGGIVDFQNDMRGTITLTTNALTIGKNLTIRGPGPDNQAIVIDGGFQSQIFRISPGVSATISELTLTNAVAADSGGAVYNQGTLTLRDCTLTNNAANRYGGALYNLGRATIDLSFIVGGYAGLSHRETHRCQRQAARPEVQQAYCDC